MLLGISRCDHKSNDKCPYEDGKREDTEPEGKAHVKMEAETGVTGLPWWRSG